MKRVYIYFFIGLVFLVIGTVFGPSVLSIIYLERGGRALDQALVLEGRASAEDPWLAPLPLETTDALEKAEEARVLLRRSTAVKEDHAQAYRWLGRTALLLDAPEEAERAFSHYLRLKPDNPLGYWELGLAYERLARRAADATYWRLDLGVDDVMDWTIMPEVTKTLTDSLASAYLETPDLMIETPYCEDGDPPASCFVAKNVWSMPLAAPDAVVPITTPVESEVLFMHPPSQATWEITLPVTPTAVTFWMGLDPQAEDWWGDGVTFRVLVEGEKAFAHHLTAEQARAGWRPGRADLSAWAGETVRLTLATGAGSDGDGAGDWAGWGDVRMVAADVDVVPSTWVRAVWESAGVTVQDLMALGEKARKSERYADALEWYARVAWVAPGSGDPWYYVGLTYENLHNLEQALNAYERAGEIGHFQYVFSSMPSYRIGMIYQLDVRPRRLHAAVAAYEKALDQGQFDTRETLADSHFRLGQTLYWRRTQLDRSIIHLKKAIHLDAEHAQAYMMLGRVYYEQGRDFQIAEENLRKSIDLTPHNKWAYYHLAVVYKQEGLLNKSIQTCQEALDIDPKFDQAQELLNKLKVIE